MITLGRRGPQPGEIDLNQLQAVWGFGRTYTWELVTRRKVIPCRYDGYRYYVKEADARAYQHTLRRGRPVEATA